MFTRERHKVLEVGFSVSQEVLHLLTGSVTELLGDAAEAQIGRMVVSPWVPVTLRPISPVAHLLAFLFQFQVFLLLLFLFLSEVLFCMNLCV